MLSNSINTCVKRMFSESQIRILKKILFFGFRFKCPICHSHLRKMHPFGLNFPVLEKKQVIGGGYRENAVCPVCRSTDRERLLYLYLLNKTSFFTEKAKVLHVAPERELSRVIKTCSNIDYLTADISGNKVMEKMDITEIKHPAETFDIIICNHVLEHVVDDSKAMNELYRILKSGGWGILQVPISMTLDKTYEDISVTDPSEREIKFGQSDHVRIYAKDYLDRLKESGFEVDCFNWEQDTGFFCGDNKYALLQSECVVVVHKPRNCNTAETGST